MKTTSKLIIFIFTLLALIASAHAENDSPLHEAVKKGNKAAVEALLAKGADVNAKDKNGATPLQWAVEVGNLDIAELMENHILKQAINPRELFGQLCKQLKDKPDDSTRRLIVKLASQIKPAPAIPEEARKHFVEGKAIVNAAKNPAQQALAAQHFIESLKIAPWWGDAYYNLALTQELAGQLDNAERSLKWYLLSNPGESKAREAHERVYAIVKKQKLAAEKEYRERKAAELCPARCDSTKEMHR